ncbi:DASH complex subunit SPC19, partial [Phenoliferia sp. Uapishka_3]
MSRSSARQSMYPTPPSDNYWSALDSISKSLYSASSSLNSAVATLHQGTYDFPRLETVLASRRVRPPLPPFKPQTSRLTTQHAGHRQAFEVVTETEVHNAQYELAEQVEPQVSTFIARGRAYNSSRARRKIKELISRAEDGLEDLKKRERNLKAKVDKRIANNSRPPPPVDHEAREAKLNDLKRRKLELSRAGKKLDDEAAKLKAMSR